MFETMYAHIFLSCQRHGPIQTMYLAVIGNFPIQFPHRHEHREIVASAVTIRSPQRSNVTVCRDIAKDDGV